MASDYAFNITASEYDQQRRRLIFCYDDFYGAAIRMLPFARENTVRVLDLGGGTGLLSASILAAFPRARITLADASETMLAGARERFAHQPNVRFEITDFSKAIPAGPFDAVVSSLAIHHLSDPDKRSLFTRIHDVLRPGGVFVNAEQVRGDTDKVHAQNHARWRTEAIALGAGEDEISAADKRMNAQDRLSTVGDQLTWLRDCGFTDVDCTYKNGWFAVFGGTKP